MGMGKEGWEGKGRERKGKDGKGREGKGREGAEGERGWGEGSKARLGYLSRGSRVPSYATELKIRNYGVFL